MSEEALEKELNCTICFDTYTDPKILQCFHVYCQKCLIMLVIRDQQGQLSLPCPICRQVTPIPASGTAGLPSAFSANRLLDILDRQKRAKAIAERVDSKAICCSQHGGREVELFCETCAELLCMKCVIKGGKHHSHNYKEIKESFEKYKEQVTPSLKPLEKQMMSIAEVLKQLDMHCDEITQQKAAIETKIRSSSEQLHKFIDKRQDELIRQLEQITIRKLRRLVIQKNQIETLQAQLKKCLDFTRETLKTGIQHEVLVMKTNILKQVKELTTTSQQNITLNKEADIAFSASEDAAIMCKNYGRIYALNSLDPSKCFATGSGTEEAVVGEKAVAVINAVNFKGEPCRDHASVSMSFGIELVSEITGNKLFGNLERTMEHGGQGLYVFSYQPTVKGRHQLHIKADGQHIRGSPFSLTVKIPVEKLHTHIQTLSDLEEPTGLAVSGKGEVVVAEWDADHISVFSPSGKKLLSFGTCGSGEGQFDGPSGVAVDGEGNLVVTDFGNHRIQKFTAEGHFLKAVGSEGSGTQQFNGPFSIAYSISRNMVYVADSFNHRVQILNTDLTVIDTFGKKGSGEGQFDYPYGITTDIRTGRVYVTDCHNHRIQVFTAEGKFLKMFGKEGSGRGELREPDDVAVDANGLVYVSEYDNNRVSIFTSEGRFVALFGSTGRGPGQFHCPRGLAVDDSGVVYVCDSRNNRIQFF